ncbi:hypothetical protein [Streptomyces fradiae]|uniref:hypothetical protein n=1 Tax=Streptomyces fradiae TaxID=1906 RepID=UPI003516474D
MDRAVQCQLPVHVGDDHYGLLTDVGEYGTALWLRWRGSAEAELAVLSDCSVVAPGPDRDGCCLFAGHSTHHTWEDAPEEVSCTS